MKIFVFGAGKVGSALARALRRAGDDVTLRPARKGLPRKPIDAAVIILSIRDKQLAEVATALAAGALVKKSAVVVHNSGAMPADVLAPLRGHCAGVAQMHPMISFASKSFFPTLTRGQCHVKGDAPAEQRARALARKLGMTPRTFAKVDTVGYHAAAGLVANGAAALAAIGQELLVASGVPAADAPRMLGPLLRSVAENVEALGFPEALTGPVRRGDAAGIERQVALLNERLPAALPLFLASARAQLPLARQLADAPAESFDALEKVLAKIDGARRPRA
ncbi:MAG: Ketopantoate reductase PanG [Labilithrix sp.]|nr:Ketopantoate reductase PanG [Labilithrix sp.]